MLKKPKPKKKTANERKVESIFNNYTKELTKTFGNRATYTSELNALGKHYFGTKYHGTYPSDMIPTLSVKQPYAIINVDTSKQTGSHWVGVYRDAVKRKYLVFDSFGRKTKKLIPAMYKKYKPTDTDYDKNQKTSDSDCGFRSIAFLRVCHELGWDAAKLI